MRRQILLWLALAFFGASLVVAWLPPVPDGSLAFTTSPCDGSIAAAFEAEEKDGSDPYFTNSCRDPARRQLVGSGLLLIAGVGTLVLRSRHRTDEPMDRAAA
jgi:hypothetical protein